MHRTKKRSIVTSLKHTELRSAIPNKRKHHKVRLKFETILKGLRSLSRIVILLVLVQNVQANRPPRFIIEGQSEIVLRLKESPETEVGE